MLREAQQESKVQSSKKPDRTKNLSPVNSMDHSKTPGKIPTEKKSHLYAKGCCRREKPTPANKIPHQAVAARIFVGDVTDDVSFIITDYSDMARDHSFNHLELFWWTRTASNS